MNKSPFKFLDPFTLEDKNVFFGRKKETRLLHRQVLRTRLLLLYGLSGTGKTSLIQCGLAGEFNGPDWLPIWVRHQTDINDSLQSAMQRILPEIKGTVPDQIRELYQHYFRPVYLIFDQFEELFIFGKEEEKKLFTATLKSIVSEDLPCTVLLVIREEFLGRLYPIEKVIPGLFDFRMRVEPMEAAKVKEVLINSFREFNISIIDNKKETESDNEQNVDNEDPNDPFELIISNVSQGKSGIELPYLQVYLDQLYRRGYEDADDILPGQKWPDRNFTRKEIKQLGTLKNVLAHYLSEQKKQIQEKLTEKNPSIAPDTVKNVLDKFVSEEGTKRPIRYIREQRLERVAEEHLGIFPVLPPGVLTACLQELETAQILRFEDEYLELAHDSLAAIINNERTDEQRDRNNMKSQIRLALTDFGKSEEYLTTKQLVRFEDVVTDLNPEERQFYEYSQKARKAEAEAELNKEKQQIRETRNWLMTAIIAFVIAVAVAVIAIIQFQKAEKEKEKANQATMQAITLDSLSRINLATAEKNLKQFQATEFKAYLLDAETFLKSGEKDDVTKALKLARTVNDTYFMMDTAEYQANQKEIVKVEAKRNRK